MPGPVFLIATELSSRDASWADAGCCVQRLVEPCARILGFTPRIQLANIDSLGIPEDAGEVFIIPACLDFSLFQREKLSGTLSELRRARPEVAVHHDDVDPGHPLLVEAFANRITAALAGSHLAPQRVGLLLVTSGHGDSGSRAQTYRLMRLLWERLSVGHADAAFLRHAQTFFRMSLEECSKTPLHWLIVPQMQWDGEHLDFARTILDDHRRAHPEAGSWELLSPPGDDPALSAWLEQRIVRLWQSKRQTEAARAPSVRHGASRGIRLGNIGDGLIAEPGDREGMAALVSATLPKSDVYLVKVTWHGYAPGTFTDAAALDLLLSALPGRAILLEGHTTSRNRGAPDIDWSRDARQQRAWLTQEEAVYLERTGLAEVIARHRAQYVNVTEEYWNERRSSADGFVPELLMQHRGAPMISFAKFKGPTRLSVSNLFGLIPEPLRTAWHGPDILYFARVCCEIAKIYAALFPLFGMNEALYSAVRWERAGLYRSRWGNYDLLNHRGVLTLSEGLPAADVLASRLQGQDVTRSGFFDVVRAELGWPDAAASQELPRDILMRFV